MVADAATVHLEHPYGIFLALVQIVESQCLYVQTRKGLMAAVVLRSYETVEQPVVAVGKLLLEGVG